MTDGDSRLQGRVTSIYDSPSSFDSKVSHVGRTGRTRLVAWRQAGLGALQGNDKDSDYSALRHVRGVGLGSVEQTGKEGVEALALLQKRQVAGFRQHHLKGGVVRAANGLGRAPRIRGGNGGVERAAQHEGRRAHLLRECGELLIGTAKAAPEGGIRLDERRVVLLVAQGPVPRHDCLGLRRRGAEIERGDCRLDAAQDGWRAEYACGYGE